MEAKQGYDKRVDPQLTLLKLFGRGIDIGDIGAYNDIVNALRLYQGCDSNNISGEIAEILLEEPLG